MVSNSPSSTSITVLNTTVGEELEDIPPPTPPSFSSPERFADEFDTTTTDSVLHHKKKISKIVIAFIVLLLISLSIILSVALSNNNKNSNQKGKTTLIIQDNHDSSSSNDLSSFSTSSGDECPDQDHHSATIIVEESTLEGSEAFPYDEFGFSVAVDDETNTAIIGAPGDGETEPGIVYIFQRDTINNAWFQQSKIMSNKIGDFFGNAVAMSGATIVVGAFADDQHGVFSGSAYVFVKRFDTDQDEEGEWVKQQLLTASDPFENDHFGSSVGIDGDTIVIGSYRDDHAIDPSVSGGKTVLEDGGSAYVFVRSDDIWKQQAKLVPNDSEYKDEFGRSVAIHGDTIVIGAWREGECAYVFTRSSDDVWLEKQKLTSSDASYNDAFGSSVTIHDDTIVVGAIHDDHSGGPDAGSVYVFVRSHETNGEWIEQSKLVATDAQSGDHFGNSVSIHGDVAVIGASKGNINGLWNTGSVYVFKRTDKHWEQLTKLTGHNTAENDHFGAAVAIDRNTLAIGAFYLDWEGKDFENGSAYMFRVKDCIPH